MSNLVGWLFDPSGLTPHGFCLLWEPGLIWTYALSDAVIGLAYFSIPAALIVVARRRSDLVFRPLLWLFAAFILLCGTTHWLDLLTLWVPAYGLGGVVKAATAGVSLFTAVALWQLLPQALTLPSPAQFREANEALRESQARLAQSQKMEAVGQLTGGIAHDFNNMLHAITSGLTLLERRISEGRVGETGRYLAAIRQAAESAARLTNRLLVFSRLQRLQATVVDPNELVRGMKELIERTIGPSVRLELRLGDEVHKVLIDANQLESAILNLAINARDAMPEGGSLSIATAERALGPGELSDQEGTPPGDFVEIAVTDSGEGMPADVLPRAFEPFFTTKPTGAGTGLGLSQVYGFVRQSGGVVRLESEPGRGTTVRLYLPRNKQIERPANAPKAQIAAGDQSAPRGGKTVLVVEDVEIIRAQIVEVLRDMGCDVLEAKDGPDGLRILQSNVSIDLLLTDVGLPGINGRQLADRGRELRPGVRVLLVTGYASKALGEAPLAAGIEVMAKPFAIDDLALRVGAMLRDKAETRS
jgi:signal transduction histidine kinase/ActR/RegA family two-component response regulator